MKTHKMTVKQGNKLIVEKSTNLATAEKALHDAVRHVHGWSEKATAVIMASSADNFRIKNPNGKTLIIKKL